MITPTIVQNDNQPVRREINRTDVGVFLVSLALVVGFIGYSSELYYLFLNNKLPDGMADKAYTATYSFASGMACVGIFAAKKLFCGEHPRQIEEMPNRIVNHV